MSCIALNIELTPPASGGAPEWVQLIPAGPQVKGLDGRSWLYDDEARQAVTGSFAERGMDLLIDWEHASEKRAPQGEEAPAAGWGPELATRDGGALWGRVNWTPRAAQSIANREYRYLSPVFEYDPATRRIVRLVSAALVNHPNLPMTALNREESPVPIDAKLMAALCLAADADVDAAVTAVNQLKASNAELVAAKASNSEQPSLERFVPRADYDQLMVRATNAETKLTDAAKAEHAAAVDAAIDGALKAGKIAPASADYYRASCAEGDGLARFTTFIEGAPVIGDASGLDERRAGKANTALNAEERAVAKAFGMTSKDFAEAKAADHDEA